MPSTASTLFLSLALLLALTLPAHAQLDFDGLSTGGGVLGQGSAATGEDATLQGTGEGHAYPLREGAHPTSPHWDGLARGLEEADDSLERAMQAYADVLGLASHQTDGGTDKYMFEELERYNQAVRRADELSADMLLAHQRLVAAAEVLETMEESDEPLWALEGRVEHTRLVTIFDQLREWTTRRKLYYDTRRWGDQQDRPFLTSQWETRELRLPRTPGVRADTHLSPSMAEPLTLRYVAAMDEALEEAEEARAILERERHRPEGPEDESRSMTGWIYYKYETEYVFDRLVKPSAVRFALAMTRAKAALNAAVLATEAPSNDQLSEQAHMDVRMAMIRYCPQVWWGDYRHLLRVSSWGFVKEQHRIFDGSKFREQFRIDTGGIESEHYEDVLEHFQGQGRASTLD